MQNCLAHKVCFGFFFLGWSDSCNLQIRSTVVRWQRKYPTPCMCSLTAEWSTEHVLAWASTHRELLAHVFYPLSFHCGFLILFLCDFVWCDVKRNTTYKVFTDLSGLATCDYGLAFNRPIRPFMERGTRRTARGLRRSPVCTQHFH